MRCANWKQTCQPPAWTERLQTASYTIGYTLHCARDVLKHNDIFFVQINNNYKKITLIILKFPCQFCIAQHLTHSEVVTFIICHVDKCQSCIVHTVVCDQGSIRYTWHAVAVRGHPGLCQMSIVLHDAWGVSSMTDLCDVHDLNGCQLPGFGVSALQQRNTVLYIL